MKPALSFFFIFLFVFFFSVPLPAAEPVKEVKPTPPGEQPEEVAHTYIRGMADLSLNVVADSMHSSALENFQQILNKVADALTTAPADRKPSQRVIDALFGDEGPDAMKTRIPRDNFVRFMSNLTTFVPQIREMTAGSEYQVLGHVDEGDLAHVVFRATLRRGERTLTKMEVLTLKRDGERWKVLLTDDLINLVGGLSQSFLQPRPAATPAPSPKGP